MSKTFLALDILLDTRIALKILRLETTELLSDFRDGFAQLCGLFHPHLCSVHDFGSEQGPEEPIHYYTEEYIEGVTLEQFAHGKDWAAISTPLVHALSALAFLHRLGMRHGDFKEQNILVDSEGRGVLTDFGCVRAFGGPRSCELEGSISGTPGYLATELLTGAQGDGRSDLYSLGVILSKLSRTIDLPKKLSPLISRLTAEDPTERPADVHEVLEAFGVTKSPDAGPPLGLAPRLIGRDKEMDTFSSLLDALLEERPTARALLISGPPGIGRTRLLREMKWKAQLRCSVVEGEPSGGLPSMLERALKEHIRAELSSVLDGWQRLSAGTQPIVFILDDTHLFDEHHQMLLHAILRTISPTDRAMLIVACTVSPKGLGSATHTQELPPLSELDVATWSEGILSPAFLPHLHRLSGGYPAYLEAYLAKLSSGELREDELTADMGDAVEPLWQPLLDRLGGEAQACLGAIAMLDGALSQHEVMEMDLSERTLGELHRRGYLSRDGAVWKLTRSADSAAILSMLESTIALKLHVKAAKLFESQLDRCSTPEQIDAIHSHIIFHLLSGDHSDRALELLESWKGGAECDVRSEKTEAHPLKERGFVFGRRPPAWLRVADALVEGSTRGKGKEISQSLLLEAAQLYQSRGHPERGVQAMELLRSQNLKGEVKSLCSQHLGTCHLKLGNVEQALEQLRQAIEDARSPQARAPIEASLSRALILQGSYVEAIARAQEGLLSCQDAATAALLHENVGTAALYLGEISRARSHLREAANLHESAGCPRDQVRVEISQAIQAFREGDSAGAIAGYRHALEIAEKHALSDLLANAALNLGTACQQRGDLGPALISYERGLRIAASLGKVGTEVTLRFNIANLYAVIGLLDRAENALKVAGEAAIEADLRYFDGATDAVRGEIALARGDLEGAEQSYRKARDAFESQNAAREIVEVDEQLVAIARAQGDLDRAWKGLEALEPRVASLDASDLLAHHRLLKGTLLLDRGEAAEAIMTLDEALDLAEKTGQRILSGELEQLLAGACEQQGSLELADGHRKNARRLWERVAASLPERFRDAFWNHPNRRSENARTDGIAHSRERLELQRVFEINRRLNSSLSIDKILEHAIDAAIEITGAERGFVLLAKKRAKSRFEVPVARNVDHERIGRSHLKFSRGIAEEVIHSGDPVLTVDAQHDERFAKQVSVHNMKLRSVACVPIRTSERIVGALYLDNRFARARFRQDDLGLLLAFADQVALALRNAWLVADLERRTEELEAEKGRVEELMRGQVEELDRLQEEVRTKQEILEYRYDYSHIIGRSPAMRALLGSLDRVIDTTLSVLIQGESGTGKELIARAIHFNSPRKERPFISVNCAALPDTLLESELFGHVKGAFTGADQDREGLFVAARGGSLFLDELGEMSLSMQSKLLRAIQEREVQPLGSTNVIPVDIRLVCATNQALADKAESGEFRQDLYYRVAVIVLDVPPLRSRLEDVPALSTHLIERLSGETKTPTSRLSQGAIRAMLRYHWPGNVRELENVLAKATVMTSSGTLAASDLDLPHGEAPPSPRPMSNRDAFEKEELQVWVDELNLCRWNISEAARRLGVPRNTIYRRLRRHGIMRPAK